MIYLDNAATTNYKPQSVIDAVNDCIVNYSFNPNRSGNKQAIILQQKIFDARRKISLLANNDSANNVVFTSGCTEALNLAILGTAKRGHVIISTREHNSVLRPVMQLQKKGYVEVTVAEPDENGEITADVIARHIRQDTYLMCISHASNVNGDSQKLYELGILARQNNLLFLVDCAQSMGYFPIDMNKCNVDMAAIAGHKGLHGIQGAGALVFNKRANIRPIRFGGTGTESELVYQPETVPDGLESGTLPCPAIIGMSAGVDFWLANWQHNRDVILDTQSLILQGLKQIKNVNIYSRLNNSGIVAFNVGNIDSNEVADELSQKYDIAVRGGLQCAPLMHKYLGTSRQGVVRASVSCVTTKADCYALLNAVEAISKKSLAY